MLFIPGMLRKQAGTITNPVGNYSVGSVAAAAIAGGALIATAKGLVDNKNRNNTTVINNPTIDDNCGGNSFDVISDEIEVASTSDNVEKYEAIETLFDEFYLADDVPTPKIVGHGKYMQYLSKIGNKKGMKILEISSVTYLSLIL